jgi:hypothetical protein
VHEEQRGSARPADGWGPDGFAGGAGRARALPDEKSGGEGIRTPGILADSTDFKSAAFDHSATPPGAGTMTQARTPINRDRREHAAHANRCSAYSRAITVRFAVRSLTHRALRERTLSSSRRSP